MNVNVQTKSGLPIYEQIERQIKEMIVSGELKEGEMLPSIRSLAADVKISVITVKRAYEDLEAEGMIYSVQGKGFFVDNISKGGLVVSLDVNTGQFSEYGLRKFDATKYYEHPDTHIAFKGLVLDNWNEIKALVEKACQLLPYYKSVGYDIACTTDGPVIVEINTGTGVFAPQIGREEGIADVLKKG